MILGVMPVEVVWQGYVSEYGVFAYDLIYQLFYVGVLFSGELIRSYVECIQAVVETLHSCGFEKSVLFCLELSKCADRSVFALFHER